jgi:hypothetical protein
MFIDFELLIDSSGLLLCHLLLKVITYFSIQDFKLGVDFKKVGDTAYSVECTQITEKMQ